MSLFGSNNGSGPGLFGSQTAKPPTLNLSGISSNPTQGSSTGTTSGNAFGTANTSAPAGGTFGNAQNTNQNQGGGLFGGASQPQQTSSLFGNAQQSQPSQTGGLFGSASNAQQSQAPSSNNLFGSSTTNQQQAGGGLFGSSTNQNTGGGLFGSNQNQNQPQQQSGGGLFGSSLTSQPAQTSNLFGGASTTKPSGTGVFGAAAPSQPQSNLFGQSNGNINAASANNPQGAASLFGGYNHLVNQPTTGGLPSLRFSRAGDRQPQATIPGVRIDLSNMRSTTRFTDLHDEIQKEIVGIEKTVEGQIKLHDQIAAVIPQHQENLGSIPQDVGIITGEVETVELAMYNDSATIKAAKDLSLSDIENARRTFTAIEAFKMPSARSTWAARSRSGGDAAEAGGSDKQDLVRYFKDSAEEMSKTLAQYEKYVAEIESHLRTVEANTIAQSQQALFKRGADGKGRSADDQVRELASVLREFEGGIRGVAGKVGGLRDEVSRTTLRPKIKR